VLEVLKHIKVDKSPGPDEMYPRTLWEAREGITGPLAEIFESSIDISEVPEDRRAANVMPLFKKGCSEKPGNCRPVSLMSVVEKVGNRSGSGRLERGQEHQGKGEYKKLTFVNFRLISAAGAQGLVGYFFPILVGQLPNPRHYTCSVPHPSTSSNLKG